MPHGPGPDWDIQTGNQVASLTELGELGARLNRGLGATYRSGRLMFATSFADGLAEMHQRFPIGSGAKIALDTSIAEYGKQSLKLSHGNVVGNTTTVARLIPGGFGSRLGFEVSVWNLNSPMRWQLSITNFIGGSTGNIFTWQFTTTSSDTAVAFLNSSNVLTPWINAGFPMVTTGFHNLKMVIDGAAGKYARMFINGAEQLNNGAALSVPGFATTFVQPYPSFFQLTFKLEARQAANLAVNLGSMVVTIDEP